MSQREKDKLSLADVGITPQGPEPSLEDRQRAREKTSDLAAVKAEIAKEIETSFHLLRYFVCDGHNLRHSGYSSLEDATTKIIKRAVDRNERRIRAFERKWPD